MKVLILGATGYIGLPVAQAFVRNGHVVYGSTRNQAKAAALAAEEILPLVGDAWVSQAASFDVIIDAASGGPDVGKQYLEVAAKASKQRGPYKTVYVYTSGTWVHGDILTRGGELTDERAPIKTSPDLVAWRPAFEQVVLTNPDVTGIVIRPALLYGRTMSLLEQLFAQAKSGAIEWIGAPGGRYSLIHQDDLADLYLRICEAAPVCAGLVFDASNPFSESVDDILNTVSRVAGVKEPWKYRAPTNAFEVAMTTGGIERPSLGRALVGWVPKKAGLVDGMPGYYAAWAASRA